MATDPGDVPSPGVSLGGSCGTRACAEPHGPAALPQAVPLTDIHEVGSTSISIERTRTLSAEDEGGSVRRFRLLPRHLSNLSASSGDASWPVPAEVVEGVIWNQSSSDRDLPRRGRRVDEYDVATNL
jgi:hypothetical protein